MHPSPSHLNFPIASTSAQSLIGNTKGFQETFSSLIETVRVLRKHIATSNSSSLLTTSYEFESDLSSLISQVATVADACVDMEEDDSDYERTRSNIRFSLRNYLDTVEQRRLECAAMCLAFVVDALYAFMTASVQEVSKWKADHQPRVTIPDVIGLSAEEEEEPPTPHDGYIPIPIRTHRPSILKRLRSLSTLNLRRPSAEDRRCSALQPLMAEQINEIRRISLERSPRSLSDLNPVAHRSPTIAPNSTTASGMPDCLQRVLRRCKSAVKLTDNDHGRHQRNRSRTFTRVRAFTFSRVTLLSKPST